MGMIEILDRGHEKSHGGRLGSAVHNIREGLKCLEEDFETLLEAMEEMGERGGEMPQIRYRDDKDHDEMRNRYDDERYYRDDMGERRGVKGTGRYSRYR